MTSSKIFTALIGAAVMTASVAVAAPTSAQAQVTRIPQAAPGQMLPVYEVINIVRAHGLDPVGAPLLHGVTYRTRAMDRAGRDLSVVVDARYGDILLVERADPLPYPERRITAMPPGDDDPEFFEAPPEPYSNIPPPAQRSAVKPTPRVATMPAQKRPPLPKPKPEAVASSQSAAPLPTAPAAAPPAPKAETAPATEAPTKWKDEPAPTNAPAAAPKVPDVAPLE